MSVAAPTSSLGLAPGLERTRPAIGCASCGEVSLFGDPFCARCGSRVTMPSQGRRPADVAATRSLQFALLVVVANAVVGSLTLGVVMLVSDAARLVEASLFLEGIKLLVVAVLATTSIRLGVRGLRDTADGALRRRGWAIAGILVSSAFVILVLLSFAAVLVFALA